MYTMHLVAPYTTNPRKGNDIDAMTSQLANSHCELGVCRVVILS